VSAFSITESWSLDKRIFSNTVMTLDSSWLVNVRLPELLEVVWGAWVLNVNLFSDGVVSRFFVDAFLLVASRSDLWVWIWSVGARVFTVT